jgi:DNA ligase (NAD+)
MDIDGLGERQIDFLFKKGLLTNITSIYKLKGYREEILSFDGYQDKSVTKLLNSIENSKKNSLEKLIFALGIRYIGAKTSLEISQRYKTIKAIEKLNFETINSDSDFGIVKSESLVE